MRSRYSAFALGDARYLAETWHPRTRPERLDLDPDVRWVGLRIVDAPEVGTDTAGIVEFRARWRHGAQTGEQHERSRFRRAGGRWWYLDAETGRGGCAQAAAPASVAAGTSTRRPVRTS